MANFERPVVNLTTIDNYNYKAYFYYIDLEGRTVIKLQYTDISNRESDLFYVYTSISEGGILRLCIPMRHTEDPKQIIYAKGQDYVTETFIHMDLQKAIYENLEKNKIPHNPIYNNETTLAELESRSKPMYKLLSKRQFNSRRQIVDALEPLRLCPTAKCFTNKYLDYIFGLKSSEEIEFVMEPILAIMNKDNVDNFFRIMRNEKDIKIMRKEISEILSYLNSNTKNAAESEIKADIKVSHYFKKLNEYLSQYIDYKSIENFQFLFANSCKILPNLTINNIYHSFEVTIDGIELVFIINFYSFNEDIKNKLIITNIIPKVNPINKFGVYDKILSVGILIYKILDYKANMNSPGSGDYSHYSYIGNYLEQFDILKYINGKYFS
jgi:hypothetical protein